MIAIILKVSTIMKYKLLNSLNLCAKVQRMMLERNMLLGAFTLVQEKPTERTNYKGS